MLTTHLHLVLRFRVQESKPPIPYTPPGASSKDPPSTTNLLLTQNLPSAPKCVAHEMPLPWLRPLDTRPFIAESLFRPQANTHEMYSGHSGTRAGFSPNTSSFPMLSFHQCSLLIQLTFQARCLTTSHLSVITQLQNGPLKTQPRTNPRTKRKKELRKERHHQENTILYYLVDNS